MTDGPADRRDFLKLAVGAAVGSAAVAPAIAQALALPANRVTGAITPPNRCWRPGGAIALSP